MLPTLTQSSNFLARRISHKLSKFSGLIGLQLNRINFSRSDRESQAGRMATVGDATPSDSVVYVQHDEGKDMMVISFEYNYNGRIKQFNLNRPASAPLSTSLQRIKLNFDKLLRNKKTEVSQTSLSNLSENVSLLKDGKSVDPDATKNIDAWVEGAILELNDQPFHVKRNMPQVTCMKLPSVIMKGFIVLPTVTLSNCDIQDCKFTWYRSISASEHRDLKMSGIEDHEFTYNLGFWQRSGSGMTYSPPEKDVARNLLVVCHPSDGTKSGPKYEVMSSRPVELGPIGWVLEKRHSFTSEESQTSDTFRFVTYNILADLYADSDYSRDVLFAHCPAYALEIDYRRQLLLKEIDGYHADIVCLQEVDKREFYNTYEPYFKLVSRHMGVYNTKGGQVGEGVATFYRSDKFELVETHGTVISHLIEPPASIRPDKGDESIRKDHPILHNRDSNMAKELLAKYEVIRSRISINSALRGRLLDRHTVLQTTLLKSRTKSQTYVIVANTHLYFAPDADHIRLLQGSVCVKYLEYMKDYYKDMVHAYYGDTKPSLPIIFCGDMNSTPECGLYQLLHNGRVGSELPDWSSNKDEAVENLTMETNLRFSSAYKNLSYTNYTPGFKGCLDYIYFELDGLSCKTTVPLPNHEDVLATGGLPSDMFPSDHIALIATLKYND